MRIHEGLHASLRETLHHELGHIVVGAYFSLPVLDLQLAYRIPDAQLHADLHARSLCFLGGTTRFGELESVGTPAMSGDLGFAVAVVALSGALAELAMSGGVPELKDVQARMAMQPYVGDTDMLRAGLRTRYLDHAHVGEAFARATEIFDRRRSDIGLVVEQVFEHVLHVDRTSHGAGIELPYVVPPHLYDLLAPASVG